MLTAIRKFRIISLVLAILFLVNTSGICLDFHYCQGKFKTFKFYGQAESCHKKAERTGNSQVKVCHHKTELDRKSCCKNEMSYAKLMIDFGALNQISKIGEPGQKSLLAADLGSTNKYTFHNQRVLIFPLHKPPLPERKLFSLFQQFLC
jgi:hypothetical protein